jgi:hypothetical protein
MIPTRSQVEAYTTDRLVDAAEYWDGLADRWEDAHWQVRNQAHALDWQGFAGDALRARTASDYIVASDHADLLGGTSRIARQQAGELERLRNRVLYAVEDAHDADFTVGEDLSVTDTRCTAGGPAWASHYDHGYAAMPRRQDFGASSGNLGRRSIGRCIRRGRGTQPGNFDSGDLGWRFTDL